MSHIVRTVTGDVDPDKLGYTLPHEHLSMDFTHFYRKPPHNIANKFKDTFKLDTIGYIRQYPYSSKDNLILNDQAANEAVLRDVKKYKKNGGGTIVENTTEGLERDIKFYEQISKATGVKVVAGTGYYIADMQSANNLHTTCEDLYEHMMLELTTGCVDFSTKILSPVKAGFIGEIASVWPIRDFERKAIQAAGEVQSQFSCGVSFHPHRHSEAPFEIIRIYAEAGGKIDKAVMSHLDRTLLDLDKLLEFSELNSYCQFDLFGTEVSYYQLNIDTDMPSDAQRLDMICNLLDDKRDDKILMSHDIHTKHRLVDFGGHGYSHILTNVIPRMKSKGISRDFIAKITIKNPSEWLSIPASTANETRCQWSKMALSPTATKYLSALEPSTSGLN